MNNENAFQGKSLKYSLRLSLLSLSMTIGLHALLFSNIVMSAPESELAVPSEEEMMNCPGDTIPPEALCAIGITSISFPTFGYVDILARDFDLNSTDNCTASEDLTFSFSKNPTDTVLRVLCDKEIAYGFYSRTIYVGDEAGNYDSCVLKLVSQNCDPDFGFEVSSEIYTESGATPLFPIEMQLDGAYSLTETITGGTFNHHIPLCAPDLLEMSCRYDEEPLNGVSTFDLLLINRHILDITPLPSPYRIIAADVNQSGTVTAFDMYQIRRLILGLDDRFSSSTSWHFIPASHSFVNPENPFLPPFPEHLSFPADTAFQGDFIAIKSGDVNESAQLDFQEQPTDRSIKDRSSFYLQDQLLLPGKTYTIPVYAASSAPLYGFQFELGLEASKGALLAWLPAGLSDLTDEHILLERDRFRCSWNKAQAISTGDQPLFQLQLRAHERTWLSELIHWNPSQGLRPEAYIADRNQVPMMTTLDLAMQSAPVINCNEVETCNSDSTLCSAIVQLRPEISSDCIPSEGLKVHYKIDLDSDGHYDQLGYSTNQGPVYPFPNPDSLPVRSFLSHFPQADGTYSVGEHLIEWIVIDSCGMEERCEQRFVVKDCTPPELQCEIGVVTLPPGTPGFLYIIEAQNHVYSVADNCTPDSSLNYSYSLDINDRIDTIYCGPDTWDRIISREVYVWDEAGNYSMCEVYFVLANCDAPRPNIISAILTEEGDLLRLPVDYRLSLNSNVTEAMTNTGFVEVISINQGDEVKLELSKNDDPQDGVTTFDLILMSRHILGIQALDSPYKIIAADVNHSGSVTTFDMLELRKLILGIDDHWNNNTSWRFVLEDFVFPNPQNPFQDTFPEFYFNPSINYSGGEADFIAIKTGDVNNSRRTSLQAIPSDRGMSPVLPLYLQDLHLEAGKEYTLPLNIGQAHELYGWQMELVATPGSLEWLQPESSQIHLGNEHIHITEEERLRISWHRLAPYLGAELMQLRFRAKKNILLSEAIRLEQRNISAEAYANQQGQLMPHQLALEFEPPLVETTFAQCMNDTIPPTPLCMTTLTSIPCWLEDPCDASTLGFKLHASDFDLGSTDNCTPTEDLIFSFSADPNDTIVTHPPYVDGLFSHQLHIWDEAGNVATCDIGYILNVCETSNLTSQFSGQVFTEEWQPVLSFQSSLKSHSCDYFDTTNNSYFSYPELVSREYEFQIDKNDHHQNGVSTFDLITINRHILAIDTLDSPYKRIAADINRSGNISTFDLFLLRRLILGLDMAFSQNTSWRFIRSDYLFPDPENPFGAPFAEPEMIYQDAHLLTQDYIGIKIGDVTGNVDPNTLNRYESRSDDIVYELNTPDQQLQAGQRYLIPVYAKTDHRLLGLQFTLNLAPGLTITDLLPGQLETLNREHFRWEDQQLHLSWHDMAGINPSGEALFYLEVDGHHSGWLSEGLGLGTKGMAAEIYTEDHRGNLAANPLKWRFDAELPTTSVNIYPNPTRESVNIQAPASIISIQLYAPNGQLIHTRQSTNNIETIHLATLPSGLYLLQLTTETGTIHYLKLQKI